MATIRTHLVRYDYHPEAGQAKAYCYTCGRRGKPELLTDGFIPELEAQAVARDHIDFTTVVEGAA